MRLLVFFREVYKNGHIIVNFELARVKIVRVLRISCSIRITLFPRNICRYRWSLWILRAPIWAKDRGTKRLPSSSRKVWHGRLNRQMRVKYAWDLIRGAGSPLPWRTNDSMRFVLAFPCHMLFASLKVLCVSRSTLSTRLYERACTSERG